MIIKDRSRLIPLFSGVFLVVIFWIPIYWTPANCCGHAYMEGWTIAKHFVLGHDSCVSDTSIISFLSPLVLTILIIGLISYGLGAFMSDDKKVNSKKLKQAMKKG